MHLIAISWRPVLLASKADLYSWDTGSWMSVFMYRTFILCSVLPGPFLQSRTLFCSLCILTLKALPRQWSPWPGYYHSPVPAVTNVDVLSPFFLISLLMLLISLCLSSSGSHVPSISMSCTVLVTWLSSLYLTCPYDSIPFSHIPISRVL